MGRVGTVQRTAHELAQDRRSSKFWSNELQSSRYTRYSDFAVTFLSLLKLVINASSNIIHVQPFKLRPP